MMSSRAELIASLMTKKLQDDLEQILSMLRQGFDVFAQVEFPEVKLVLLNLLNAAKAKHTRAFTIVDEESMIGKCDSPTEKNIGSGPIVIVGEQKAMAGYGFVHFIVRSPDQLLCSVGSAIETILLHFNLEFYLDVFDAKKLSRLKQIARVQGALALIDAVVQTAYYGGYKGDADLAQSYLDKAEFLTDAVQVENEIPLENCAKKFLSHVVSYGEDAHLFMKSCLSYYVVSKQGHTMTRASQILSISRTTLQEHLKIAHNLGVSSFLEGSQVKNFQ